MKTDYYLSDSELEELIKNTESEGLLQAPADISDNILSMLDADKILPITTKANDRNKRQKEFSRYCMQLIAGIAASILVMVGISAKNGFGKMESTDEIFANIYRSNYINVFLEEHDSDFLKKISESDSISEYSKSRKIADTIGG